MTAWGGWHYTGGNGMRVGADWAIDGVDTNTGTFHVHYWWYVQTQYNYSGDVQALNFSGWYGGSQGYTLSSGHNGITLVAERDAYYNYSTWGSSPGNIQVTAQVSGAYNGSTPSLFLDIPIYARPYAPPYSPWPVSAVRNSDTSSTVSWGIRSDAQRPWTSVTVDIDMYTPQGWVWGGNYVTAAVVDGGAASFTHNSLADNRLIAWRVRSNNSVGNSGFEYTNWVYMTPAAPSNVHAVLGPTGATIPITWQINHYSATATTQVIERSVGGGAWTQVASGLAWNATSWEDPSPGGGTNQYRVRSSNNGNGGAALLSGWGTSNVVSTVVPPLAPTLLAPDGASRDLWYVGATLTWQHNPGADFAAQTHYTIEVSSDGGGTWTALAGATNVASAVSSHTVAPGVLANGVTYLWKVKTQGGTTAAFGPFSASATISAETTPTVTLTQPDDPTLSLPLVTAWTYNQDQSVPQTAWEANLYAADGITLLEARSGTGTTAQTTFQYAVLDQTDYVVKVRAMSGSSMWSAWATAETTIDLPPPAPTTLVATYQPCTGTMSLSLTSALPGAGEVGVESLVVERRVAGGDWVVLARDVDPTTTMLDVIPLTNGLNEYRVTGVSSAPSTLVNPVVQVQGTDGQTPRTDGLWVFLAYGPGFSQVLRVHNDLDIQDAPGRVQAGQSFLGRRKPTLLAGVGVSRDLAVSASLRWRDPCTSTDACRFDSPPGDWVQAGQEAEVVCYRDFTGRRLFGMLSGVSVHDETWPGNATLGFKVTEMDYAEVTGVLTGS